MMKKTSLNQTFTLSLTIFTLCVIGVVTWFFYNRERTVLLRELKRHGLALTENLAYNSEYNLLFFDIDSLKKLVNGVVQNKDVQFAVVVDINGGTVAEKALKEFPTLQKKVLERVFEILTLLKTEEGKTHTQAIFFSEDYDGGYHIFAPIFVPTIETETENQEEAPPMESSDIRPVTSEERELLGVAVVGISFERVENLFLDLRKQMLGPVLFIIALAVIIARFLVNMISRPIERLARGTQRIARGDLTQEVEVSNPSEIRELAQSFNQMMHDLRSSRQELERWTETLEHRVRERTSEIEEKNTRLTGLIETMKRIQEQLVHSEKMASLGQLVAGIAHEINNPVNFISSNITPLKNYISDIKTLITHYDQQIGLQNEEREEIEAIKDSMDFDFLIDDLDDLIQDVETGAARIKHIVLDLRNFSRLEEAELKTIDLHESLDTTLNLLGHIYENRISVHKYYGKIPDVECYAGQLNQVLMNLLANAAQAVEHKGNVWITTAMEDEETCLESGSERSPRVIISIRDDGKGISEDVLSKIFDPFFTTKDVGEGTGLGLSISYGIIENHRGEITVNSRVGEGTEFIVSIPRRLSEKYYG